jgi:hypothetical protein
MSLSFKYLFNPLALHSRSVKTEMTFHFISVFQTPASVFCMKQLGVNSSLFGDLLKPEASQA